MGRRIHKVLGYGLTDVQARNGWITDPRINSGSPLLNPDAEPGQDYASYLKSVSQKEADEADLERALLPPDPADGDLDGLCTWQSERERGLPEVLVVRPAGFSQWYRYDDVIDYQEYALRHGWSAKDRVEHIEGGIYPFEGLYMDSRTGEKFQRNLHCSLLRYRSWVLRELAEGDGRTEALNALAAGLGYRDHAESEQCIVPWVPDGVRLVCAWGQLFTSPEVCFQLKPMLYTYWA